MFVFSTKTGLIKIDVITKNDCPASNLPIMVILPGQPICTHFYFIYPNFVNVFFFNLGRNKFVLQLLLLLLITVSRDPKVVLTLWTRNGFSNSARLLNALQAVKAKTVQIWQLLWISELGHTHSMQDTSS